MNLHRNLSVPLNKPFREFPVHNQDWRMASNSYLDQRTLDKLKPTDYLEREYIDSSGRKVYLYIGYHNGGKESGRIRSPKSCLPLGGWVLVKEEEMSLYIGNKKLNLVRAVYQRGAVKVLFLYWFQIKGKCLPNIYRLKLEEIYSSIMYGRKDTAFIRISVPFEGNEEDAFAVGVEFVKDFYPTINSFLP
jgi:EpsI family protein